MYLVTFVGLVAVMAVASMAGFDGEGVDGTPAAVAIWAGLVAGHVSALVAARQNGLAARVLVAFTKADFLIGVLIAAVGMFGAVGMLLRAQSWEMASVFLAWAAAGFSGVGLALRLASGKRIPEWLLPVRGIWARRLLAVVALVLLQLFAASSWALWSVGSLLAQAVASFRSGPAGSVAIVVGCVLWIGTLPLYYAPLYYRLVRGEPEPSPPNDAGCSLHELLAIHERRFQTAQHGFARLVLRHERALHKLFCEQYADAEAVQATHRVFDRICSGVGVSPADELLRGAVHPSTLRSMLEVIEAEWHSSPPGDRRRMEVPESMVDSPELWTVDALSCLPPERREITSAWLDGKAFGEVLAESPLGPSATRVEIKIGVEALLARLAALAEESDFDQREAVRC